MKKTHMELQKCDIKRIIFLYFRLFKVVTVPFGDKQIHNVGIWNRLISRCAMSKVNWWNFFLLSSSYFENISRVVQLWCWHTAKSHFQLLVVKTSNKTNDSSSSF